MTSTRKKQLSTAIENGCDVLVRRLLNEVNGPEEKAPNDLRYDEWKVPQGLREPQRIFVDEALTVMNTNALGLAASRGHLHIVKMLLYEYEADANPNWLSTHHVSLYPHLSSVSPSPLFNPSKFHNSYLLYLRHKTAI